MTDLMGGDWFECFFSLNSIKITFLSQIKIKLQRVWVIII